MKSFYQSAIVLLLITVLVFAGCQPQEKESKLLDEVVTKYNITDLFKKLREDKDFKSQDFEYFTNGMTRLVTKSTDSLLGKTIGQVITLQKNHERDEISATAANQATKVELVLNHEFKYVGMNPRNVDLNDNSKREVDFLIYEITNKSEKEITDLEGILQFITPNNETLKIYPIVASKILKDEVLKPGETKRFSHPFNHDINNPNDERVRNEHSSLRPIWIASKIIFKDGSQISVTKTL
ncbi:MAG: hypothetical protein KIT33_04285 [Candidatus Kapabacteria bacterium]|nr:hypothetical protein [Ignavibacteriota bacterium]MCW5884174.1 hypothetical protein [Candidatus Kapabacteria bacterium]